MTCRDIFDKIKEENVMHEKILNQKIIESQTNLKNILQKIKAEMEKNAIFSDVNYDDYQATSIKTTESPKQTQIQETQSFKESGKKLANTLEKVLNHEKRSRRNSAQLKRNKKKKFNQIIPETQKIKNLKIIRNKKVQFIIQKIQQIISQVVKEIILKPTKIILIQIKHIPCQQYNLFNLVAIFLQNHLKKKKLKKILKTKIPIKKILNRIALEVK